MTIAVGEVAPAQDVAPPVHPAVAALDESIARVSAAAGAATWSLSDDDLTGAVQRCERLRAGVHAVELSLVGEAHERNVAARSGAASTAAWLTGRFRIRPGQARSWVQLATSIADPDEATDDPAYVSGPRTGRELVATGQALAAGEISPEHAAVVDKIMGKVPRTIDAEQAASAEADLAGYCRRFDPVTVAKLGDYMVELMREDTLDDAEGDRHRRRNLRLDDYGGGLSGQLTREGMAMLRTALDPLAAPAPAADGTPDQRTAGQRLADALVELARRAIASDQFATNHGISHRVMVMIGLDSLAGQSGVESDDGREPAHPQHDGHPAGADAVPSDDRQHAPKATGRERDGVASGTGTDDADGDGGGDAPTTHAAARGTDRARSTVSDPGQPPRWATGSGGPAPGESTWGTLFSAGTIRRITCHAGIQRIVVNPNGAVLDVGRDYRTATPAQFTALIARDRGCAFPGCTRPPAWCIAHHIRHWADGGETNLDNLVMLCGYHHRVVHHNGWDVVIDLHDRLPTFYPPRWIDPDRRPRRNNRPRLGMP